MSTKQGKAGGHVTSADKAMATGTSEERKGKLQLVAGVRFTGDIPYLRGWLHHLRR